MSLEAVLAISADPAEIRIKKNITGDVPGKLFRNECHYIMSRQSASKDTVNRQTKFAPWVPEALRLACRSGRFPGYLDHIPTGIKDNFIGSLDASTITAADM